MEKRQKSMLIIFIWIVSFLLVTPSTVQAYFSDTNSIDTGIDITLGSIDLEVGNFENTGELKLGNGVNEIDIKHKVQNKGTLDGKLAYKINAKKADGTDIDASLLKSLKITVNNRELNMNSINQYSPVSTQDGDDFYLIPEKTPKEVSMKVKLTSDIQQTQIINIEVEYMLFQTNGTVEKPFFYDVDKSIHEIALNKKDEEIINPPEEENSYWPTSGWIDHGNIRYNKENYSPIMYFSEIKNSQQIKNLNDIIFYIDIKNKKGIELKDLTIRSPEDMLIEVEHVNDNQQHLKVTISIDETKFKRDILSVPIDDYSIASYNENNFNLSNNDEPITLRRILLSTDEAGVRSFNVRPINLFAEERDIYLAQAEQDNNLNWTTPLTKIPFVKSSDILVEVSGDNADLVEAKKMQAEANSFILKPRSKTETKETEMDLSVLLEGTSGEILEVERDIQLLPTISGDMWPQVMTDKWGIPDGKGNYGKKATFALQVSGNKFISTNSTSIYVNNPYKEELHFTQTDAEKNFNQTIYYSPDGKYMRVGLKFISDNLTQDIRPYGFHFIVFREKDINTSVPVYVNNTWVELKYTISKEIAQYNQNKMAVEEIYSNPEVSYEEQFLIAITNGEKELYIDYTQLPSDFNLAKVEEDIRSIVTNKGDEINFVIEDVPELKAIKITVQE